MKKISFKRPKEDYILFGVVLLVYLIMLVFNLLTHMIADDYAYMYSWYDSTRIASIGDIFRSMAEHYTSSNATNGRVAAHFFVQLFLFLPQWIFKIINAGMFTLEVFLIYLIANRKTSGNNRSDPLLFCIVFGLIFLFQRVFGQVNLWLDGSCNYLWCAVFNLLFLIPFVVKFQNNRDICRKSNQILFVLFGAYVGSYGENASIASIVMVALLLGAIIFVKHEKLEWHQIAAFVAYIAGFVFLLVSPASRNQVEELALIAIFKNFFTCMRKLYKFKILIVAYAVFFTIGCFRKIDSDKLILSMVFVIGSLCANFAVMLGSYYVDRSTFVVSIYLIVACVILFNELKNTEFFNAGVCLGVVVALFTVYFGIMAFGDIYLTHLEMRQNEMKIVECRETGVMDIELIPITPETEYCAAWGLIYLDPDNPDTWPNRWLSRYYGVNDLTIRPEPDWA